MVATRPHSYNKVQKIGTRTGLFRAFLHQFLIGHPAKLQFSSTEEDRSRIKSRKRSVASQRARGFFPGFILDLSSFRGENWSILGSI
jgi:hypothetical protein